MQSGPEQLRAWIDRQAFTQRSAATYLGFDETYVSQLVGGKRTPGLDNALLIERQTGIPVEAWASAILDKSDAQASVGYAKNVSSKA